MKYAITIMVIAFAAAACAQSQPAQAAPPAVAQAAPAAPNGVKAPPQAKTTEEYEAFNSTMKVILGPDLAAGEAAARAFQAKFPQSELTSQLFLQVLFKSTQANDGDKAVEMGREVLKLDPTNPVAADYVAWVLAETTRDTDLDAAQKFEEATRDGNIALQNVETNLSLAPGVTQQQADATKTDLKARAYDALGLVQLKRKDDAGAEKYLRESIAVRGEPGDPMSHFRLALALDRQGKYPDALAEAKKAAALATPDQPVAKLAQAEIERLKMLTGSAAPAAAPGTAPVQPPATPAGTTIPR